MSPLLSSLGAILFIMTSLASMTSLANGTAYVAQVSIYVDRDAESNWYRTTGKSGQGSLKREIESTFVEINEIYKTLKPNGVDLQLQIAKVVFMNSNVVYSGRVVTDTAIKQFGQYVKPKYTSDKYDIAILYTGSNLVKPSGEDSVYGYAFVKTVCSASALGVIELHGVYMDAMATSHELGHIFGSSHDGSEGSAKCKPNSGEIMNAVTEGKSPRHFYFSKCTANAIKENIESLNNENRNCMKTWRTSDNINAPRFGTMMTADQLCKRAHGSSSYVARFALKSYGDDVCVQLPCMTSTVGNSFRWSYAATPPGMNCGMNKQCIQGKCVVTQGGSPKVSDFCPFGDQPEIGGSYQLSCSRMTPQQCKQWSHTCCGTCGDPGTADAVCKQLAGKDSSLARLYHGQNGYGDLLCSKLACLTGTSGGTFYWNMFTAPDGMKCGEGKVCKGGKHCVVDKLRGDPEMNDDCPYGDQPWLAGKWQRSCAAQIEKDGCGVTSWRQTCCASCGDPGTADEICKKRNGPQSALARAGYDKDYGDKFCTNLLCLTRINGYSVSWGGTKAPDGLKCGQGKRCRAGKCVSTSTGDSNMSDRCPWGDQPYMAGSFRGSCSTLNVDCNQGFWRKTCCSKCGNA